MDLNKCEISLLHDGNSTIPYNNINSILVTHPSEMTSFILMIVNKSSLYQVIGNKNAMTEIKGNSKS